jgi:hypothetical protein
MKKILYLFAFLLAVTFAACDNGQPDGPSGDTNVPENPSSPNEPSNPDKPSNSDQPSEPSIPENLVNGHEFVDLGLSVKWATCNVGATKPEEPGDYYAWGEIELYNPSVYKWYEGDETRFTKYCIDGEYGEVDNKITLEFSDDVANVAWGGTWRMPTKREQEELMNRCTWIWARKNGVSGYNVVGENGNHIFLPQTGVYANPDFLEGPYGYYWSSSLYELSSCGYGLSFSEDLIQHFYYPRNMGLFIRPVMP